MSVLAILGFMVSSLLYQAVQKKTVSAGAVSAA
jgi:hypothetical protein